MNKVQYLRFHETATSKMAAITKAKNADYTGTGTDPFANFTRVASLGICSTEQGFLTRMTDKLSRLSSFVQRGTYSVSDESFEDTCLDLANYCILLAAYVQSVKSEVTDNEIIFTSNLRTEEAAKQWNEINERHRANQSGAV